MAFLLPDDLLGVHAETQSTILIVFPSAIAIAVVCFIINCFVVSTGVPICMD
jgi:hypothetical protein